MELYCAKQFKWGQPNHDRETKMISLSLMTSYGQRQIDFAKEKGTWHQKAEL